MLTRFKLREEIINYISWNNKESEEYGDGTKSFDYDEKTDVITLYNVELTNTTKERAELIETLKSGASLKIDFSNEQLLFKDEYDREIGNCYIYGLIYDALKAGHATIKSAITIKVEPKSMRGKGAKKALVIVEIKIQLLPVDRLDVKSIIVKTEGDHIQGWHQKISLMYTDLPVSDAALLFEIKNRMNNEYDDEYDDLSYPGLDNLAFEITAFRNKIRSEKLSNVDYRAIELDQEDDDGYDLTFLGYVKKEIEKDFNHYGSLMKYLEDFEEDYIEFENIFDEHIIDIETYYYEDQCRCTKEEFEDIDFNHYYEVMELFDSLDFPLDFKDEEVISSFGTDKFVSLVDLSYGC